MKEVGTHRNIVSILGYWIQSHPIMLIMEYVPNGDLLQWLRNKRQQVSLLYNLYQIKICCPLFCLLFKKYFFLHSQQRCAQVLFIELKLRQTNSSIFFVFLSLKCQVCLTFVMKITKMPDIRQTLQISHSDVIFLFLVLNRILVFVFLNYSKFLKVPPSTQPPPPPHPPTEAINLFWAE